MTAAEHSRLIYLMDALQGAPSKRFELLALADKTDASEQYREIVRQLRTASGRVDMLLVASKKLRRSMM